MLTIAPTGKTNFVTRRSIFKLFKQRNVMGNVAALKKNVFRVEENFVYLEEVASAVRMAWDRPFKNL